MGLHGNVFLPKAISNINYIPPLIVSVLSFFELDSESTPSVLPTNPRCLLNNWQRTIPLLNYDRTVNSLCLTTTCNPRLTTESIKRPIQQRIHSFSRLNTRQTTAHKTKYNKTTNSHQSISLACPSNHPSHISSKMPLRPLDWTVLVSSLGGWRVVLWLNSAIAFLLELLYCVWERLSFWLCFVLADCTWNRGEPLKCCRRFAVASCRWWHEDKGV